MLLISFYVYILIYMKCYKTTTIILLLAVVAFAQNLCEKSTVRRWFYYRFC